MVTRTTSPIPEAILDFDIERSAAALNEVARRVARDLRAPMALIVVGHDHRKQVAARFGMDRGPAIRTLAVQTVPTGQEMSRVSQTEPSMQSIGIRSYAVVPIVDGLERIGALLAADARRRWFDDDEIRHLGLLAMSATRVLSEARTLRLRDASPAGVVTVPALALR
jgi:GAF domain-containing protein